MRAEESAYPRDWLRIAEKDWSRADRMLALDDPDAAGFFLQQAVEKYLKAFLLSKGWTLKRIHDLEALLNDALAHDPSLEEFRALCQKVTGYYIVERYPFSTPAAIAEKDVRESLREARRVIERLEAQIR